MSKIEVNAIEPISGSSDVLLGGSSKNIKFASGTTVDFSTNTPTVNGLPLAGTGNGCYSKPSNSGAWSSSQTIGAGTFTTITTWENVTTIGSGVSYNSGVITCANAGLYFVHMIAESSTTSQTGQVNKVTLEGSNNYAAGGRMEIASIKCYADLGDNLRLAGACIVPFDANDTIDFKYRHDNGPANVVLRNGSFSVIQLSTNIS
tara:strand:+ start:129 stop:740 length:612 start_codon:yes stop_codon:yes gene_type:complete